MLKNNFKKAVTVIIILISLSNISCILTTTKAANLSSQFTSLSQIASSAIIINSKTYNFDITGLTDTSVEFQKMINECPNGTTIQLPKGIYKFENSVKLKDGIKLITSSDVTIIGTGNNTLFSTGNSNSFQGINFQNCATALNVFQKKGLSVTNCKFTNKISYVAINFYGSSDSSVTNSYFYDILKYGILIDSNSSNIKIDKNNFDNSKVYGGYKTEQIGGHIYCLSGTKISVTNNILKNSGGQGVIFTYNSATGKGTTSSVISNNQCLGNGQEGITIYGGKNRLASTNSVIGNTSKNNRFNQIEIWQSNNNIVKNNIVDESIIGTGNLGAICLFSTTNTSVTGNTVLSSQSNGIAIVAGSLRCNVSVNIISNTNRNRNNNLKTPEKGNGILLDWNGVADPQYITMVNNKFTSSKEIIAKSGIYSTSNKNHYNKISGTVSKGYEYGVSGYALATCQK